MESDKLDAAIAEAVRFHDRAVALLDAMSAEQRRVAKERAQGREDWEDGFPAMSASVRRASMDLTKALADLRRRG